MLLLPSGGAQVVALELTAADWHTGSLWRIYEVLINTYKAGMLSKQLWHWRRNGWAERSRQLTERMLMLDEDLAVQKFREEVCGLYIGLWAVYRSVCCRLKLALKAV